MRVIIAGSRDLHSELLVHEAVAAAGFDITTLVNGGADGIDLVAYRWAEDMGIPIAEYPADWKRHGRAAGPIRNRQMAENADALIAISRQPITPGTANMVKQATERGLKVYVHVANGL